MYTVKYCPICKKDLPNPYCIPEYFIRCLNPKEHDISQFVDTGLSENDFEIINAVSDDATFLEAMIKLKQENIIEYNLKMSQFKTQLEQKNTAEQRNVESNTPHCPTCNSTNLKKITISNKAVNTALFGLLGTKRNKTYHCNNCGYEW